MDDLAFVEEPARRTPVRYETQVLVVGGGSAGVAAAVAAARQGADVTLVERSTYLGGIATGGLVILLLFLDDGRGRQVVAGLCEEVTQRLAARDAAYFPPQEHWGSSDPALLKRYRLHGLQAGHGPHAVRYGVAYGAEEMKLVLEELCREAGVRLLYNVWACEPILDGDRVRGVTMQAKNGRFAVLADVVIDTSGDGDVFSAAGCAHAQERVAPWLWFTVGGVQGDLDAQGAGSRFWRIVRPGHVLLPWGATDRISRLIDATDPEDLTFAATECRKLVTEEFERLRREVPGFADAHLCHVADQIDVTESRRLVGEYVLGREDLNRRLSDVVAVTGHWTMYGATYDIPYRALLTKEYSNLLTAGRCISVDHRVHHATKEIPACMATGEAAGTAAALALACGGRVKAIPIGDLQERLTSRGAILWPYGRA